ncbi:MAG TPA: hypothetical protein V6D02_01330 [Candidatus Obscuribacterales bacterium]
MSLSIFGRWGCLPLVLLCYQPGAIAGEPAGHTPPADGALSQGLSASAPDSAALVPAAIRSPQPTVIASALLHMSPPWAKALDDSATADVAKLSAPKENAPAPRAVVPPSEVIAWAIAATEGEPVRDGLAPVWARPPGVSRPNGDPELGILQVEEPSADPELGTLQVQATPADPELGVLQLRNPLQDSELGILELRSFVPPPPPRPVLFISTYVTASSSDNVFLVEDPVQGRFGDTLIRPGINVSAFPAIGPNTNLLLSAETNLVRYQEQQASSYDEVRFRAGIRHRFTNRAYGQLSLSSQMLFDEGYSDQFFTNNGIEITLGRRDPLTPQLVLDSYYQGQIFFSDPEEFSNVLNSVGAYLGYRFNSQWDTGIGYRLTISDFTQQSRHETYQRITGQLRYAITPAVRVSVFGGLSHGRSSEANITFDDSFFGISFDATIQVF